MKILIVDDDPNILENLSVTLQKGGHSVKTAVSVDEAIGVGQNEIFDVFLIDFKLPELDGFELSTILEGMHFTGSEHKVMMTAFRKKGLDAIAKEYGFKKIFYKPFDFKELLNYFDSL